MKVGFNFNGLHSSLFKLYFEEQPKIPLTPEIKDYYEDISGRNGSFLFTQPYGDKIIKVSCLLLSESKQERMELARQIARWLVTNKRAQIVFDFDPTIYYVGKINKQIDLDPIVSFGKFEIEFRCEPFGYGTTKQSVEWDALSNSVKTITSSGTAEVKPYITVTAEFGFLSGLTLEVNGYSLIYNAPMQMGKKIYIDSKNFTVLTNPNLDSTVTGAVSEQGESLLDKMDGSFPVMQGGVNTFVFRSNNGAKANILVEWEDTYI